MNINDLTLGQVSEIFTKFGGSAPTGTADSGPWKVGAKYLIRTVTHIDIGELVAAHPQELVLRSASWIADTGRYHNALRDGVSVLDEVEPYPGEGVCIVGRGAIADATEWAHELPRTQK